MSRIGKFIEKESRTLVTRVWGGKSGGNEARPQWYGVSIWSGKKALDPDGDGCTAV
jgi:hypothetical protein